MAETIEELTVNYEEDGVLVVKELDKEVLTKGAWSTILFKYQDLDRKKGEFGPVKYVIRRYRKMQGTYRPQSKFTISSKDQALKIIDILSRWTSEEEDQS